MCIEPPGTILMTLWLRWNEWLELWLMDIMYAIHIHVTINHSHSQKLLLFFFIMNNTRSGIVTVRGKGHFHFAESTSSGATNIYILQSQILCPTIREIFRITFNILWEKVSIIREIFKLFIRTWHTFFFFRELSAESERVGCALLLLEVINHNEVMVKQSDVILCSVLTCLLTACGSHLLRHSLSWLFLPANHTHKNYNHK